MTTFKKLDRKDFLSSTVAAIATVTLGGCASDADDGGTENTGGTSTGGTATGGTSTGGTSTGGTATGGTAGSPTGGTAAGGTATGGTTTGGSAGAAGSGGFTGGTGGAGSGGDAGGGGTLTCSATMTGDHMHPLNIPPSDIERGYQDAPYVLQDGGTGHTHTLELDSYEFVYLNAGVAMEHESSMDNGHSHLCNMICTR